jgi:hypothetical protein
MSDDELFDTFSDSKTPWQRQSCVNAGGVRRWESPKAHQAFRIYAEMADERSMRRVAIQLGKSRVLIERWAKRWRWAERTAAYDGKLQEAQLAGCIKARRLMSERQSKTAVIGQDIALMALTKLQQRLQAKGKERGLTAHQAVRLFEACSKIERICRGGTDADNDQVAAINVTVCLQEKQRYLEAAEAVDPAKEFDR